MSKFYYLVVTNNPNPKAGDGEYHSLKEVKRILDNHLWRMVTVYKVTKNHYRCIFDYDWNNDRIYVDTKQLYGKYINIPWNKRFN